MQGWYIYYNNNKVGPMSRETMLVYRPKPDTLVWKEGMEQWQPLFTIPELMEFISTASTQAKNVSIPNPSAGNQSVCPPAYPYAPTKDKTVAALLAIFLGQLGAQYFYLGKNTAGIISIVITVFNSMICFISYFFFIGFLIWWIWPLLTVIQGVMMLAMSQSEFERKFVDNDSQFPII